MNTIGKILVILNLVLALVVAGFCVIDFATRTNWKNAYDKLLSEMVVTRSNTNVSSKIQGDLNEQVRRAEAEKEELKQKLMDKEKVAQAQLDGKEILIADANNRAKDADLSAQKLLAEATRLKEENKGLTAIVQNRDKVINDLQDDNRKIRQDAIAKENRANETQARNVDLLARITELERAKALSEAGVDKLNNLAKDPNTPNPPPGKIKGRIDRVDSQDRNLVVISLGSDQGLKVNHTLEVYRTSPTVEYLGMIRIVDVKEHTAVGKLVRTSTSGNRALQVGDTVASSISAR